MMQRIKSLGFVVWAASLGGSHAAHAFIRTPLFDKKVSNRAAIIEHQNDIFDRETDEQKKRPIWLHGGDSLSTAWRTRTVLRELYTQAAQSELPSPTDPEQAKLALPSLEYSWYTGTKIGLGLLGRLETMAKSEWVMISGALAGTTMVPLPPTNEEQFERMEELEPLQRDRVKLITFSLGANDLCSGKDPLPTEAARTRLSERLQHLRAHFPNSRIIAWQVVDVVGMRNFIFSELNKLPAGIQRDRITNFCTAAWKHSCEAAETMPQTINERLKVMQDTLTPHADRNVNILRAMSGEILDLMSGDCFHPSSLTQATVADTLLKEFNLANHVQIPTP